MRRRGAGLALIVVAVVLGLGLALGSYPTHSDVFWIGVQLGFFVCLAFVLFIFALLLVTQS